MSHVLTRIHHAPRTGSQCPHPHQLHPPKLQTQSRLVEGRMAQKRLVCWMTVPFSLQEACNKPPLHTIQAMLHTKLLHDGNRPCPGSSLVGSQPLGRALL